VWPLTLLLLHCVGAAQAESVKAVLYTHSDRQETHSQHCSYNATKLIHHYISHTSLQNLYMITGVSPPKYPQPSCPLCRTKKNHIPNPPSLPLSILSSTPKGRPSCVVFSYWSVSRQESWGPKSTWPAKLASKPESRPVCSGQPQQQQQQ
jgi:hypothetical protein